MLNMLAGIGVRKDCLTVFFYFPSTLISSISGTCSLLVGNNNASNRYSTTQLGSNIHSVTTLPAIKITCTKQKPTQTSLTGKRFCDSIVAKEHDLWRYKVPWVLVAGIL